MILFSTLRLAPARRYANAKRRRGGISILIWKILKAKALVKVRE